MAKNHRLFYVFIFVMLIFSCREENDVSRFQEGYRTETGVFENATTETRPNEEPAQNNHAEFFLSPRYVNSIHGLNRREYPSTSSRNLGTLLHGARIVVRGRSDFRETIGGITDYWYEAFGGVEGGGGGRYWVFGGFLSVSMPYDAPSVLGYWTTDRGERYFWFFSPGKFASFGIRETGGEWIGDWSLSGDNLTITTRQTEFHLLESEVMEIIVTVINRDKILLTFADGRVETLIRSTDIV